VQTWVEMHGFSVVREFVGHGIGEKLHEEPQIPNYGQPGRGPRLRGAWCSRSSRWWRRAGRRRRCWRWLDGGDEGRQRGGALRAHRGGVGGRAAGADGAPGSAARRPRRREERRDGAGRGDRSRAGGVTARAVPVAMDGGPEVTAHAASGAGAISCGCVGDRVAMRS
jgi:hypothetical protein